MSDAFGVTPAMIAAELGGTVVPSGFTSGTTPDVATVTSWIAAADATVAFWTLDIRGASIDCGPLAVRYVVEWTKARAIAVIYAGRDPLQVAAAVKTYDDVATALMSQIKVMRQANIDKEAGNIQADDDPPSRVRSGIDYRAVRSIFGNGREAGERRF